MDKNLKELINVVVGLLYAAFLICIFLATKTYPFVFYNTLYAGILCLSFIVIINFTFKNKY